MAIVATLAIAFGTSETLPWAIAMRWGTGMREFVPDSVLGLLTLDPAHELSGEDCFLHVRPVEAGPG